MYSFIFGKGEGRDNQHNVSHKGWEDLVWKETPAIHADGVGEESWSRCMP